MIWSNYFKSKKKEDEDYKEEGREINANFEIELNQELNKKMLWLVNNYKEEIGAWLVGEITPDKIIIEDFLVPNQDVSGTSVDTSGKALVQLRKEYGDRCKKIIGHWHSHNNMTSYWSGTDEKFIEEFTEQRGIGVYIVSSIKDGHRLRVELTKPLKISLDELDYKVDVDDSEIADELKKIIEDKVEEKKYVDSSKYKYYDNKTTYEKINDNYLTRKKINAKIVYNSKDHNVTLKDLTYAQYNQIEGVFPVSQDTIQDSTKNKMSIKFFSNNKNTAIQLMKDIKDYMFVELNKPVDSSVYNSDLDKGYADIRDLQNLDEEDYRKEEEYWESLGYSH